MQRNVWTHAMVVITSMVYVITVVSRVGRDISARNKMVWAIFYKRLIYVVDMCLIKILCTRMKTNLVLRLWITFLVSSISSFADDLKPWTFIIVGLIGTVCLSFIIIGTLSTYIAVTR